MTDPAVLGQVVARFRAGSRPVEREGDMAIAPYSAPSAGAPPWAFYRFTFHAGVGVATTEPFEAARWR